MVERPHAPETAGDDPPAESGRPAEPLQGKPVGAVLHAVRLLRVLAEAPAPLGVTAAARQAGVIPSTALSILRTLVAEGLVAFDPARKSYAPGLGLLELSRGLMGRDVVALLHPELVRIATTHACLVALWRITEERAILIDRALADTPVRLDVQVTQRMPCLLGAIGRIVAARLALSEEELRRRFAHLRWHAPMPFETWRAEVEEAGRRGYGLDRGTLYAGIHVAASAVVDGRGRPFLGISAIALAGAAGEERLHAIGESLAALSEAAAARGADR